MVKVYIEIDEGWRWWPVTEQDPVHQYGPKSMSMEVPQELLTEYNIANTLYQNVQEKLEALYRVQEGMNPHPNQVVPEYTLLKEKTP
jgi:hypothetical protein